MSKINVQFPGSASLLGVLFIALKLLGKITWPWIWVLCPFWLGAVLAIFVLVIGAVIAVCAAAASR